MRDFNKITKVIQLLLLAMLVVIGYNLSNNLKTTNNNSKKIETPTLPPPRNVKIDASNNPIIGDSLASVNLIVFSDFECLYCYKLYEQIKNLEKEFIETGLIKITFINYPLKSHDKANFFAKISEYAYKKGVFKDVYEIIFENHKDITRDNYSDYLLDFFPDKEEFTNYINKPNLSVVEDMKKVNEIGIKGTPAFIINNVLYVGIRTDTEFKNILNKAITETENICD
ncbi:MAG: hypothetical protein DRJ01_15560 [Bacteroidetes bacterium]|nr:MAG: hypothetical protein DRJ01_15560 [Bacteroidota bacterium]